MRAILLGPICDYGNGSSIYCSGLFVCLFLGVIVAIVIASVAVLVATVRLFVYCCHRRRSP